MVYAQNAKIGGPTHRALNETVNRMLAALESGAFGSHWSPYYPVRAVNAVS